MSVHLDIVGSIILAGMLMLGIARFNADRQAALLVASNTSTLQMHMESATSVLLFDLRKAGNRVTSGNVFLAAEPRRVVFRGDLENDGRVDTVIYMWSGAVPSTPNPRDTLLWRVVNPVSIWSSGTSAFSGLGSDLGLSAFRFRYYDKNGIETATLANIRTVRVIVTVESRYPVQNGDAPIDRNSFQRFSSDFRVSPRNLNL